MQHKQQGGTAIGFILGLIVGMGAALGVAVYVTKVPVPFVTKGGLRSQEQDAAEAQKNRNWNPNQGLQSKNAPPPAEVSPGAVPAGQANADAPAPSEALPAKTAPQKTEGKAEAKLDTKTEAKAEAKTDTKAEGKAQNPAAGDPLGDFAKAKATAAPAADTYEYYVQAGAFNIEPDADAQRAKLAMLGWQARVSENKKEGRSVFRVRVGPFAKRDDAAQLKDKLDAAGVPSNLVRVHP